MENQLASQGWVRTREAAKFIGSTESTMEKRRLAGLPPVYSKIGRKVVYSVADLEAFMASNRRSSTSDLEGPHG